MVKHFITVHDPRIDRTRRHKLIDILVITIVGVLCGAESWDAIEAMAEFKATWLKGFLELANGIPSHDTIARVISRISPMQFERAFLEWMKEIATLTDGEVIAIDGKTLRRSFDTEMERSPIHMVSAWAATNGLVLGQVKVDDKSNEITAIPKLLELLTIVGCTVTIDAMGCQKEIAVQIIEKEGDYVFGVKLNQPLTLAGIDKFFEEQGDKLKPFSVTESGHGRVETRSCSAVAAKKIPELANWPGCKSAVAITSTRTLKGKTSTEIRFYISSLKPNPEKLAKAIRAHWGIENNLHWVLDVQFNEDKSRVRNFDAAENLAIVRHTSLNLLRKETSFKGSINKKRLRCLLSDVYLQKVIFGAV